MGDYIYSVIIDTDPGIDDAAAIFWILQDKRFDVKALTITHGNVGTSGCASNAMRILDIANRQGIPVYKGAEKPLIKQASSATYAHGKDGLGDTDIPFSVNSVSSGNAAVEIVRIARNSDKKISILAIGPITNIAIAILIDPELYRYVDKIIFMGGAVRVPGNVSVSASFNVYSDPEAAKIVYDSGIPIVQIGLDICNLFSFHIDDFRKICFSDNPVANAIVKMTAFRIAQIGKTENRSVARNDSIALNDVAAAAYLINPDWFTVESVAGEIAIDGICRGMTVLDFAAQTGKEKNVYFASNVDALSAVAAWVSAMIDFS